MSSILETLFSPLRVIGEALDNLGDGIGEWFGSIRNKMNDLGRAISDVVNNIKNGFTNLISEIKDLFKFEETEYQLPNQSNQFTLNSTDDSEKQGVIGNFFVKMFKYVFVPPQQYFHLKFSEVRQVLENKMGIDNYTDFMEYFRGASGGNLQDVKVNIMGVSATIIDFSILNSVKSHIHGFVRGVIFVLLILYNIDQIYYLIRGTHFFNSSPLVININNNNSKGDKK